MFFIKFERLILIPFIMSSLFFSNKNLLITDLKNILEKGDLVYIKGSRSMEMEEVIIGLKS